MPKKAGILLATIGAVLILSALLLFLYNEREDRRAGQEAELLLVEIQSVMKEQQPKETLPDPTKEETQVVLDPELPTVMIDGFAYVGYLTIPDLELTLPVMSEADYVVQRNGTLDGQDDEFFDEENFDTLETELIRVKTRTGNIKYMPKDCTALDFAFKIHQDVGYGFKYAIINGSKTKAPPYAKLYDGDQVEIIVEKDGEGDIKYRAEIKWFAYVNTTLAKKKLIKYFKDRLQ